MNIIRSTGSYGISRSENSRENGQPESRRPGYLRRKVAGEDSFEISSEARTRFEIENVVRIEKLRLEKEAGEYFKRLSEIMDFREADMRNTSRPERIVNARWRIFSGYYDKHEGEIISGLLEIAGIE